MKWLITSFVIGLAISSHAQTQQWGQVYFANHVLRWPPDRLVRLTGSPMPLVGTNFIAELLYGTNLSSMVRLSNAPPAPFRPESTLYPGTWSGGMRTLVGIPPGTPIVLVVRIWNNDAAGSYEEALQQGTNAPYFLASSAFTYVPPPPGSPIEAHYMSNFSGLTSDCGLAFQRQPSILVQPTNQTVRVGDDVIISVVTGNAACYHQWQFNGTNLNVLPGSRFLLLTNVQPSQAGEYRVILNGNGGGGITSQVARLTVEPPPQWGQVLFANNVLTVPPDRRPFFPDMTPVVGTNFVAQLFYGTNDFNLIAVTNPPAPFREPSTSSPGTWRGGMRTLVGIPPGTPVRLQVRIWDILWGQTYEEADSNRVVFSRSPTFDYMTPLPDGDLGAYFMVNFGAFGPLGCGIQPWGILQQPTNQVSSVGETVIMSVDYGGPCRVQWQFNGADIPGQVFFRKLRINNVQLHHEGDYRFILPAFGTQPAVTSQVARLTVRPPPQLTSALYDNGAFAFQVSEETGRLVVIETAPDLDPETTWIPVFTNTAPFAFTNSTPADRQRFYRSVLR